MNSSLLTDRCAYVVDDDENLRSIVRKILTGSGIYCQEYDSAEAILEEYATRPTGCVLLDVRLPGMSGMELLHRLKDQPIPNPIIMMSGYADIPTAISAVKAGALDFIQKPFRRTDLLRAVDAAFDVIRALHSSPASRITDLTRRERQVLAAFAGGAPNKLVAYELGLSLRTVEMHRANIYTKLGVKNLTQALFLAKEGGIIA